jgi:hypothetical protein
MADDALVRKLELRVRLRPYRPGETRQTFR